VAAALWTGGGGFVRHICTALAAEDRAGPIKPGDRVTAGGGSGAEMPKRPDPRHGPRTLCYAQRELLPDTVRDLLRTVYS
jgi:hypothetical protein